jgi:Kef-type K+ transport system membrane component KefB
VPSREPWAFAVVALFLSARAVGKLGGARLAARANGVLDRLGKDWGLGLLGQGGLALALCINYTFQEAAILQDVVFTGAIASVLLTDFLSARLMHAAVLAAEESAPGPLAESELTGGFDAERDEEHASTPIPGGIH